MHKSLIRRQSTLLTVVAVAGLLISFLAPPAANAGTTSRHGAARHASAAQSSGSSSGSTVTVGQSSKNDVSPKLRNITPKPAKQQTKHPVPVLRIKHKNAAIASQKDTAVQNKPAAPNMPSTQLNFDGISYPGVDCYCAPPDTNGDIGNSQYVQIVNEALQVFDKSTGNSVLGPISIESLWSGFGGPCETFGEGDPTVNYDQLANRWVVTEFADFPPSFECVAVSTSDDATGTWNRYAFDLGTTFGANFYDYPKLGVWPDAYYMSFNIFNASGTSFLGPQPFALDRTAMLAGNPATIVSTGILTPNDNQLMPADMDGSIPPPDGAPNPFTEIGTSPTWAVWRFHADFTNPGSSTFTQAGTLTPDPYSVICNGGSCVPQAGVSDTLDTLGDRSMFRNAYRRFPDGHEALVGNMTVDSNGVAGVRWYEIDNATSGTPGFAQQSTYQPDDTWRWMGSAAMDASGDLAVGFSASSSTINPQIRYAGRLAGDPPNTLAQGEATLFAGTGSQIDTNGRWGDYSDLTVDPTDDCTFWYTNEYYATNGSFNWKTRVGNFKFPNCTKGPSGIVAGTVTDASTGNPIAGAKVDTSLGSTTTDASGNYSLSLPVGTYDVTYSRFGYATDTETGVAITDGNTTTENVALQPSPAVTVSGTITDGSGHGWPVYSRIDVAADPDAPFFTDPVTGRYSIQLPANASYDVTLTSQLNGYQPVEQTLAVGGSDMTDDAQLPVTPDCTAPGYSAGSTCVVVPGGLVEGNVYDLNSGDPINRATVQSVDQPTDKATSRATPDDPNNPDGFYYLFSSLTGSHAFTASASLHANDTETVNVAGDNTVRQDFKLGTGHLTIAPTSVTSTQELGSATTQTLSFTNDGTGPAHVKLSERSPSVQILHAQGAKLDQIHLGEDNQASPAWLGANAPDKMPRVDAGTPKDPTWSTIAPYPTSIMDNGADVIAGKEYSVGGIDSSFNITNKGWVYSSDDNSWAPITSMANAREKPGVAAVNGKLYVSGGWDTAGNPVAATEVYDPSSDTWTTVAPNPSPTAAPGVAVVNDKIYFVGGCADGFCTPSSKVEVYDTDTDSWSSAADYPSGDSWQGCGGVNGQVYCAGGINGSTSLTTAYGYDPAADSWSPIASMPTDVWGGVSGAPNGLLVISGGVINNGSTVTNQGYAYDPSSDSWSSIPNAQFPRYRAGGGCGYYKIGGSSGGFSPTPDSEFLSDLDQCGTTNVPWLDENPAEFDVPVGQTVDVTVTLSATNDDTVTQPGKYAAQIAINANTPQTLDPIDVTMNVTPPKDWGKLAGVLQGTDCNGKTSALKGVVYADSSNFSWTAKSGTDGTYAFWGPKNSYSLIASAKGWIPKTTSAKIKAGRTTEVDFTLRPDSC